MAAIANLETGNYTCFCHLTVKWLDERPEMCYNHHKLQAVLQEVDARTAQRLPVLNRSIQKEGRKPMRLRSTYVLGTFLFCLILGAGTAMAQDVFPAVSMSYNAAASSYTYHVSVAANNSFPFGQLLIFTKATSWNGSEETWSLSGAIVEGIDQGWLCGFSEGDDGDTVEWRASGGQEAISSWEGDFVVIAPNTAPVAGLGMTKDGGVDSVNYFDIPVPGLVVPEPSSMLALGSLIGLAVPVILRRRK